jgi:phosphoenolpyruvate carboxykinase (ATP)
MMNFGVPSCKGIEFNGLTNLHSVFWNLSASELAEQVVLRQEGVLTNQGAVTVKTGQHTGRSPNDKYIVDYRDPTSGICWGKVNQAISPANANRLHEKMRAYLQGRDVFVQDMQAGTHQNYAIAIRVITENAWQSLFARDLFIRLPIEKLIQHIPQFTVLACPNFMAIPEEDGTKSPTFIILDFDKQLILIGGTSYAGEIKKSIFTVMNYLMPLRGVLSMHCSANVGNQGETALFFGLSGTGKTTLSSDPERKLIGDDEHGWAEDVVFNFEGGCYAKTIKLRPNLEPLIWEATRRFGTVLENVVYDHDTRIVDFDDDSLTENTRGAYPIEFVPNHVPEGYAGHPENIFFLTADAFGVLPPISRLTPEQAMYYFLSGYTSKLAGTEKGLSVEPQATFSACFGAPFLPLPPQVYAKLLGEKISLHKSHVWLVNTGWIGGAFGVGERISLPYTRAMIRAVLTHKLDGLAMRKDELFGLWVPQSCPEVPDSVLDPRSTWQDKALYRQQAEALISKFVSNFDQFISGVEPDVAASGPHLAA